MLFRLFRYWFQGVPLRVRWRSSDQTCFNCAAFDYCDPDDIEGSDGYCCHANHAHSEHHEYGGHWTSHDSWCGWWSKASDSDMHERSVERALALRKAADAVDPSATDTGKMPTRDKGFS